MSLSLVLLLLAAPALSGALLVLPPEVPHDDKAAARLAEAVSDLLPHALAYLDIPVVERADRLLVLEALEIPSVALTRATSIRIAEACSAPRLVVGELDTDRRLSLRILDAERATLSAPFAASGPAGGLAELVDGLAWEIALAGGTRPSRTRQELLARRRAPPLEALAAYADGLSAPDAAGRGRALKRALQLAPSFDEARLELGRLQLQTRDHRTAFETLGAIQSPPMARTARFLQGRALLELGRYRDAEFLYWGLVATEATPAALNNHALALLRQPSPALRASDVLRKAVELGPADADVAFNLGFALLSEGEGAAAAFWLQGVVRANPRDAHARVVLSWALRRAGRSEEAELAWRAVVALAPTLETLAKEDLTRRFERILVSDRRPIFSEAARSHAELAAAHLGRAEKALAASDTETAARELRLAAFSDPYSARAHVLLARLAREAGDSEQVISQLRMAVWCRDDAAVRVELAQALLAAGRDAEARAEAALALKADPSNEAAKRIVSGR